MRSLSDSDFKSAGMSSANRMRANRTSASSRMLHAPPGFCRAWPVANHVEAQRWRIRRSLKPLRLAAVLTSSHAAPRGAGGGVGCEIAIARAIFSGYTIATGGLSPPVTDFHAAAIAALLVSDCPGERLSGNTPLSLLTRSMKSARPAGAAFQSPSICIANVGINPSPC